MPHSAKTTDQISAFLEWQRGLGKPRSVQLRSADRYLFVIWNCPFSGADTSLVFAYFYDGSAWTQFYSGSVGGAVSPSIEAVTNRLLLGGAFGKQKTLVSLQTIPAASKAP
jgi:hypothetical protein